MNLRITKKIRLFVAEPLIASGYIELESQQAHYLSQVMRREVGDSIHLFNGEGGEWRAEIAELRKKAIRLQLKEQVRTQQHSPDVWLVFAPIKNKTELVVEKAVELGVSKILCTYMKHSVVVRINHEKLAAHAIEAAEQCERLDVPAICEAQNLGRLLSDWPKDRLLLYGDESGQGRPVAELMSDVKQQKVAILIGPEGGFSADEHHMLRVFREARGFGMGPRILRADTAAVAALACVMSETGDWKQQPHFMSAS